MNHSKRLAIGLLCLGTLAAVARAEVIDVPAGQSIQAAIDLAKPGTTLRLAAGTYYGRVSINKSITLEGAGWDQTTVTLDPKQPPGGAAAVITVQTPRRAAVVFRGLRVQDAEPTKLKADGPAALVRVTDAECEIDGCAIVGGPGRGVSAEKSAEVRVVRSLIAGVWDIGVYGGNDATVTVADSEIRNCYYSGIVLLGFQSTVERSRITGAAWHGIRFDRCGPTIRDNLIAENARCGIYTARAFQSHVENNTFQRNEIDGISCWDTLSGDIRGNRFSTMFAKASAPSATPGTWHFRPTPSPAARRRFGRTARKSAPPARPGASSNSRTRKPSCRS